jgi:hypothetical protein
MIAAKEHPELPVSGYTMTVVSNSSVERNVPKFAFSFKHEVPCVAISIAIEGMTLETL